MKFSELTSWVLTDKGNSDSVIYKISGENITADFPAGKYACAVFERELKSVKSNFNYKIISNFSKEKLTVKIIIGFKNSDGVELNKVYAENDLLQKLWKFLLLSS